MRTLVGLLYGSGHVLLVLSGLQHSFSCFCEVFLWYTRREEKKNVSWAPQLSTGQWEMMGGDNTPFNEKCASSPQPSTSCPRAFSQLSVAWALVWGLSEAPGPHQAALPNRKAVTWSCLNLWAPLLGLRPRATGKHRESAQVFLYDVARRTVLIWTGCDNSKLPPTKGTETRGKLSHSGQHND